MEKHHFRGLKTEWWHFDLDNATFVHVCGSAGTLDGSCQLSQVEIVSNCYPAVPNWPN